MRLLEARLQHVIEEISLSQLVAHAVHLGISFRIAARVLTVFFQETQPRIDVLTRAVCAIPTHVFVSLHGLHGACFLGHVHRCTEREVVRIVDGQPLVLAALLGRHQDDTEGCPRTVDGRSCRILQHRYRLDVIRIQHIDVHLHVVHQHQRATTIDTVRTTNIKREFRTWLSRGTCHLQTRHGAHQSVAHRHDRTVAQHLIHLHTANSACQVSFLLHTVAYDHHFIYHARVLVQRHTDRLSIAHGHFRRSVADVRNSDTVTWLHLQAEVAIHVRNGTSRAVHHPYVGTYDGFTVYVYDLTFQHERTPRLLCGCRVEHYDTVAVHFIAYVGVCQHLAQHLFYGALIDVYRNFSCKVDILVPYQERIITFFLDCLNSFLHGHVFHPDGELPALVLGLQR